MTRWTDLTIRELEQKHRRGYEAAAGAARANCDVWEKNKCGETNEEERSLDKFDRRLRQLVVMLDADLLEHR